MSPSLPAVPSAPRPGRPAPAPRRAAGRAAALATAALCLGVTVVPQSPAAADAGRPLMFGATGASREIVEDHERLLRSTLRGVRVYKYWDDELFSAPQTWARNTGHTLFLSVGADRRDGSGPSWSQIAAARPGDPLYADMRRQAGEVRAFGAPVYLSFHHEPEAAVSHRFGDGADYVAAWRTWVKVFREAGVTNARYVWTLTAYAFARQDRYRAENYYPGDAWVDDIGADGYNWYRCQDSDGKWRDLADVIEAHRQFGRRHPTKGLMIWETGSVEDPRHPGRKAGWFRDATRLFSKPGYDQYTAVLTWEGRAHGDSRCGFDYLSSRSATQAWVDMAHDPAFAAKRLR